MAESPWVLALLLPDHLKGLAHSTHGSSFAFGFEVNFYQSPQCLKDLEVRVSGLHLGQHSSDHKFRVAWEQRLNCLPLGKCC